MFFVFRIIRHLYTSKTIYSFLRNFQIIRFFLVLKNVVKIFYPFWEQVECCADEFNSKFRFHFLVIKFVKAFNYASTVFNSKFSLDAKELHLDSIRTLI